MVSLSKFVFKFTITNVLLFTERSGLQDIIHSVSLEQDIIEASILQLNKKKKEANQESQWKTCMKDKEDAWDSKRDAVFQNYISSRSYSVSKCGVCEKVCLLLYLQARFLQQMWYDHSPQTGTTQ